MNRYLLGTILAVLTLAVISGCGKSESPTLAVVGDNKITVDDFNARYMNWKASFESADDEFQKKKELLDSLIVTRLLIDAAYEKNIDKLEELSRAVQSNRIRFLLDALYQEKIVKKIDPSESEVKEFYKNLKYQVRAAHILLDNIDTANMILEKLRSGINFEKLAYDYSLDPSAKRNRGDMGYFLWGTMVDEFQNAAFAMQPGEISQPIKTRFGYHIIKLIDKTPNDLLGEYDQIKDSLRVQFANYKKQKLLTQFMDDMKRKYHVAADTATCKYLMYKRGEMYPNDLLPGIPKNDFDLERLDRNEKELVLATWDGGQISLLEYFSLARRFPENYRPNFDNYEALAGFIFQLKTDEILGIEATRLGMEQTDYFKERFKKFKELTMAEIMKTDSMPKPEQPSEEVCRAYYDDNSDVFIEPLRIHVYEILLSDEVKARELVGQIKTLKKFKDNATLLTERPGKRSVGGDLQYIERRYYPEIFDLAQKTKPGTAAGPVLTRGKYAVIWVSDKLPERVKDYLSVKDQVATLIMQQSMVDIFNQWVENQKNARNVQYYDDAIWGMIDKNAYANTGAQSVTPGGS